MTRVSVVTPVLNGQRFVEETIESVLRQKGNFELEYIVKDGGSTDDTLSILKKYAARCRIVSEKDDSPQHAINQGMQLATGDVGCWLNADDMLEPGALQVVVSAFQKQPQYQWLFGQCAIIDEQGQPMRSLVSEYKQTLARFYGRNLLLCEQFIDQPATFWNMALWRKLGGLNLRYYTAFDYDLWLRMAKFSNPVFLKQPLARFRRHADSISERFYKKQFKEELDICKNHGRYAHVLVHALLIRLRKIIYVGWGQTQST